MRSLGLQIKSAIPAEWYLGALCTRSADPTHPKQAVGAQPLGNQIIH